MLQSNAGHGMPYWRYLYHIMIFALICCHQIILISHMNNISENWIHLTSFVLYSRVRLSSYKKDIVFPLQEILLITLSTQTLESSFAFNCFPRNNWMPQHIDVTHHDALLSGVKIPECPMKVFVAWTTNDIETFKYCFRSNICRSILKADGSIIFSRRRRLSVTDDIIDLDNGLCTKSSDINRWPMWCKGIMDTVYLKQMFTYVSVVKGEDRIYGKWEYEKLNQLKSYPMGAITMYTYIRTNENIAIGTQQNLQHIGCFMT